jgi:hypothetical protein
MDDLRGFLVGDRPIDLPFGQRLLVDQHDREPARGFARAQLFRDHGEKLIEELAFLRRQAERIEIEGSKRQGGLEQREKHAG